MEEKKYRIIRKSSDELYHYGRKGQKWGVKNGPPYPLDANKVTKEKADALYDEMTNFDYGGIVNGKKITEPEYYDIDFGKDYRTIPIEVMQKEKIGNCWDMVNYQHAYFKKNGIKDHSFMVVMNLDDNENSDNVLTHTFSVFESGDDLYWFEQAWWPERGIKKINSYRDVLNKFIENNGDHNYLVSEYNPDGMDKGLTDKEFFNKATKNVIEEHEKGSKDELKHYGIKGQKWGIRRFQTYTGEYTQAGKERYNTTGRELFKLKKQESESRTQAMNNDMKAVNGGSMAVKFAKDRRANCAFCTTAYELRRRGYDVKAKESTAGVMIDLDPSYAFKDAKVQYFERAQSPNGYSETKWNEIEKQIVEEQGEGARGNLFGTYKNGLGGHSVAYEIQDGKMVVLDCQVAQRYDKAHEFTKDFVELGVIRTDNLEIDEKYIGDYVGNRSDVKTKVDIGRMAANALTVGGVTAASLGYVALKFGVAGEIAVPVALAGVASVAVASMLDKSRNKREAAESSAMVDKTLTKLNITEDEAIQRLHDAWDSRPSPQPTPRVTVQPALASRIKSMYKSGSYTQEELAKKLGISASVVGRYV